MQNTKIGVKDKADGSFRATCSALFAPVNYWYFMGVLFYERVSNQNIELMRRLKISQPCTPCGTDALRLENARKERSEQFLEKACRQ